MADLIQGITDGILQDTSRPIKDENKSNDLGKDAFLQLLVAQLKNQDPLEPEKDTEFVAQLAQYSQLEEMQNLNMTNQNSQAMSLVGKSVIVKTIDASNKEYYTSGTVDYVTYVDGKAQLSIADNLYSLDSVYSVIDDMYLIMQGAPSIDKEMEFTFDNENPEDITFEVNFGKEDYKATDVGIVLNGEVLDSKYVTVDGNKVTISQEAFRDLEDGTYKPAIVFNDMYYTTVADKITVTVVNHPETDGEDTGEDGSGDGSGSEGGDEDLGEKLMRANL